MWGKNGLDEVDSKIVKEGFIAAKGFSVGTYSFLDGEKNPFGRSCWVPIFYLWKVHKNHPIKISASSPQYSYVFPVLEKGDKRMPAEIHRSKIDYDMAMFMMVPFDVDGKSISEWEKFELESSFAPDPTRSSLPEYERDKSHNASLLYGDHGGSTHCQDNLSVVELMPSQVIKYFDDWLTGNQQITSHIKTFQTNLEGRIEVPHKKACDINRDVASLLEERYKTKLTFERKSF
jgi:hypothetical protein